MMLNPNKMIGIQLYPTKKLSLSKVFSQKTQYKTKYNNKLPPMVKNPIYKFENPNQTLFALSLHSKLFPSTSTSFKTVIAPPCLHHNPPV